MKHLLTACLVVATSVLQAAISVPAHAQNFTYKVASSCGAQSYTAGGFQYGVMDTTGVICSTAFGGTVTVSNPFALEATQLLVKADLDALVAAASNPALIVGADGSTRVSSSNALNVQGGAASGATDSDAPVDQGCRTATTIPTAVTDGQKAHTMCGPEGRQIIGVAPKDLMVRGSTGAITTTTQTSIIAAGGANVKTYITAIQCANSGATTSILTFTDANTTVLINPAGAGGQWTFPVPLVTAANTAFQVTPGSSSTSQYCSAQGYSGS